MTLTLTLNLLESLARQLLALSQPEQIALVTDALEAWDEAEDESEYVLTDADKAALRRSRADLDASRVFPLADVLNDVRREHGLGPLALKA